MEPTDEVLLHALAAGDESALPTLLERYAPAVQRFGAKMCRDPEDAKDVVQDTLFAAARSMRDYRGGASLSTWLFAIARSFCIKKRRARAGAPTEVLPLDSTPARAVAASGVSPDEAAGNREIGAALDAAIEALDPMYREVLLLRDVEGLTAPEVAAVVGIGVDAVKSRLHRARMAVRDRLAPLLSPPGEDPSHGCPDVVLTLSQYLEGDIGPDHCAEMERHLAACPRCDARCGTLRRTLALCRRSAEKGTVTPELQAEIRAALRQVGPATHP